uniref:Uncharacterized protein n=1 Tax=Rhodnius prolixus TaxID=13249 RepID=T1I2L6_RHOPR
MVRSLCRNCSTIKVIQCVLLTLMKLLNGLIRAITEEKTADSESSDEEIVQEKLNVSWSSAADAFTTLLTFVEVEGMEKSANLSKDDLLQALSQVIDAKQLAQKADIIQVMT